ncbi:efflux RND transporter permease subunit [Candidatus Sumerlaeota bacterium]|nr:efflux RND transporter permease subunit [Candidatus Sumerlaeota bacterium]
MSVAPLEKVPLTQRIVEAFLHGNLSVMLILISILCGAAALMLTPREEEPQIVVPLADVIVQVPGASAEEIEQNVATRLERLLFQIDGVEYVYSISRPGVAIVTVRFYVGEDREDSLVKIYNKVNSNIDQVPAAVAGWVVRPVEIDDVPIVNVTLWSDRPDLYDDFALRRIAEQLEVRLQGVENVGRTTIIGGRPRRVRVELVPEWLAAHQTSALQVLEALRATDVNLQAGSFDQLNTESLVEAGPFIGSVEEMGELVVNVVDGRLVSLADVATVIDGPEESETLTWMGHGPASELGADAAFYPAVHVAVAKKRGTNAVWVARAIEHELERSAEEILPDGVHWTVTRDYGETANHKVNELVDALGLALIIVIGLFAFTLGWREALIVAVAVPITFSLTLLVNYLAGYTINRVTLFALILALGLVVDDPIVDVENIFRHLRMGRERPLRAVLTAVNEVRPPIILATLAVIISFVPMFFISGMMGPYMRPMALNVPLAMAMSLVVAFTITPWMSYHMLRKHVRPDPRAAEDEESLGVGGMHRAYSAVTLPFLRSRAAAWALLGVTAALFGFACWLAAARHVPLKMLPFDNKNEFQIVIDMDEGTTLETADAAARALANHLRTVPEVESFQVYTGTSSPMDFNGLVRHYYLRRGSNVADIRVNIAPKLQRAQQSHEILLRLRPALEAIARERGATIQLVEVPPGPPVLQTVVAEIQGEPDRSYSDLTAAAEIVAERLRREPLVVDVDTTVEAPQRQWTFLTDREKAALAGVSTLEIAQTIAMALEGMTAAQVHLPSEVNPLEIRLRLPRAERSSIEDLNSMYLRGRGGQVVQLGELGEFREERVDQSIYHKNLERVVYVTAEMAGRAPAEAIVDIIADEVDPGEPMPAPEPRPLSERSHLSPGGGDPWQLPEGTRAVWTGEGEWKITLDVFRDLGIAFGAACIGIYILLVYQTGSYLMPLILMISIPLTMIGIMPGFWLLSRAWLGAAPIGEYPNPVFFTATAMIGMIALSGLAVRNAILLIEFVHVALAKGESLERALINAGAVRTRPIFLTSAAAMLAAWPITLDPIFSGLAWALIFGLAVSTAFTLLVIPTVYHMVYANRPGHGLPPGPMEDE